MKNIIVIAGPTGVGKTKLSIQLAKLIDAEIINADSMQVYKNLNIGFLHHYWLETYPQRGTIGTEP